MHDFDSVNSKPYTPEDYGLPIWRDEDHLPPQAEESAPGAADPDAPGAIRRAVTWQLETAADNMHGYSQADRWGPDYDCSSFVITAWEIAGVPVKTAGATYTGNMYDVFVRCGFQDVTGSVDLATGAGMQAGDVLLNHQRHTATYIGNGQLVHARSSEGNSVQGDQSGNEIRVQPYYNGPWDCVLRYTGFRGIADYGVGVEPGEPGIVEEQRFYALSFPYLSKSDTGDAVRVIQTLLQARNIYCGSYGADGDFGPGTEKGVQDFQRRAGLTPDGVVGPETGAVLFSAEVYKPEAKEEPKASSFWDNLLLKIRKP